MLNKLLKGQRYTQGNYKPAYLTLDDVKDNAVKTYKPNDKIIESVKNTIRVNASKAQKLLKGFLYPHPLK